MEGEGIVLFMVLEDNIIEKIRKIYKTINVKNIGIVEEQELLEGLLILIIVRVKRV